MASLNFSGVDLKVYFDANTAATISIFTFLVLPPFLLCLLCVLALVLAKDINVKIRFLLINIFTAETLNWLSFFIMYLGWPARFINGEFILCKLLISLNVSSGLLKFASTSTYAVGVYVFIKHGDKKLKWYIIIPYIVVTWIVVIPTVGVPPYLEDYGAQNVKGFCAPNGLFSGIFSGSYIATGVLLTVGALFFLSIELLFCILTFIYIKRNALKGDTSVQKAIAKVVGYMAVVSVLSFIGSVPPYFIAIIFPIIIPDISLATFLAGNYVARLLANITAFPTPIVTIILLKPVREAIKTMSKKVYTCCHKNREATTEEHSSTGAFLATTKEGYMASTDQNPASTGMDLDTIDKNHVVEATIEETPAFFQAP